MLTRKQFELLRFINERLKESGVPPSFDEMKDALDEGGVLNYVGQDFKSALQERLQALGRPLPEYRLSGEAGPDHRKVFSVEVVVAGEVLGTATGKAKKEAEQEAARLALELLATPAPTSTQQDE